MFANARISCFGVPRQDDGSTYQTLASVKVVRHLASCLSLTCIPYCNLIAVPNLGI